MRKTTAIVVGIIVAASCVPWLRHQRFFAVLAGITTVALMGLLLFSGVRALSVWAKEEPRLPDSARSIWRSPRLRNLLSSAAVIVVLIITVPHFMVTNSHAYKLAVATAHRMPQVTDVLGAPIKEAWFSESTGVLGDPARAEMVIPLQGRMRKGNLRALAIKENGCWKLKELTLELAEPYERIDLLSNDGSPKSGESR